MYAPTVLANVHNEMVVCKTETFGPVCSIYVFDTEDEAVARVNDTDYGLSAAIVSKNVQRARAFATRLKVGAVNINEAFGAAYASIDAPMGGMNASGVGRRHGAEGLLKYTEAQTVAAQSSLLPLGPGRFTDEQWATIGTRALKAMKAIRLR